MVAAVSDVISCGGGEKSRHDVFVLVFENDLPVFAIDCLTIEVYGSTDVFIFMKFGCISVSSFPVKIHKK